MREFAPKTHHRSADATPASYNSFVRQIADRARAVVAPPRSAWPGCNAPTCSTNGETEDDKVNNRARLVTVGSLVLAGTVSFADGLRFSDFTPLASSSGPTADESMPITFGNPAFSQQSIADRQTQLAARKPNSGSWDMLTINETGPHKGRYLFTVFETGQSGVQRQTCDW